MFCEPFNKDAPQTNCKHCGSDLDQSHGPAHRRCGRVWLEPFEAPKTCNCTQRQTFLNKISGPIKLGDKVAAVANPIKRVYDYLTAPRPSLLMRFPHGLGDCVQLSVVLQHIRKLYPNWDVDVQVGYGKAKMLRHLCRRAYEGDAAGEGYTIDRFVTFDEPFEAFADSPSTKAEHVLRRLFGITPDQMLCSYSLHWDDADNAKANCWLTDNGLASKQFALIHYQGNSAQRNKNINEEVIASCCRRLLARNVVPVVLDLDKRSTLRPQGIIFCREFPHDGSAIAALAARSILNIGIDSGPGHIFQACELRHVPAVIVWMRHHPVNYAGLSEHVLHVLPHNHASHISGDVERGLGFFASRYRWIVADANYRRIVPDVVDEKIKPQGLPSLVRSTEYDASHALDMLDGAPDLFLNVGVGQLPHCEAYAVKQRWPECRVIGWEPNIAARAQRHDYPGELRPCGLWNESGELEFLPASGLGESSFLRPIGGYLEGKTGKLHAVPVETLDSVDLGEFSRGFLWLDIEGAELHALRGADQWLCSGRIRWVYCEIGETPRREGEATAETLGEYLAERGFTVVGDVRTGAMVNRLWKLS